MGLTSVSMIKMQKSRNFRDTLAIHVSIMHFATILAMKRRRTAFARNKPVIQKYKLNLVNVPRRINVPMESALNNQYFHAHLVQFVNVKTSSHVMLLTACATKNRQNMIRLMVMARTMNFITTAATYYFSCCSLVLYLHYA